MRHYIAVVTVGRADLVARTIAELRSQTLPPEGILVVGTGPQDVAGLDSDALGVEVAFAERGLCRQRNKALDVLAGRADVITFFDDDFIPHPDYLAEASRVLDENPDIAGITGNLIADGIHGAGYTLEDALALIATKGQGRDPRLNPREALYGCNMVIRTAAAAGLRFDENLPLYGWQEDIDFTYQLGRRGRLVSSEAITGVHLGNRSARSPGKRLGYSQVANIVYLKRKGTMQPGLGERLIRQNLVSNLVKSLRPEPHIDRRGRLLGNLIAIGDWITGRLDPRRVERL